MRSPAFPIETHNLQAWEGKSVRQLEAIRDRILGKVDIVYASASDNVKLYYKDMLEQLDSYIESRRIIEDAAEDYSDIR